MITTMMRHVRNVGLTSLALGGVLLPAVAEAQTRDRPVLRLLAGLAGQATQPQPAVQPALPPQPGLSPRLDVAARQLPPSAESYSLPIYGPDLGQPNGYLPEGGLYSNGRQPQVEYLPAPQPTVRNYQPVPQQPGWQSGIVDVPQRQPQYYGRPYPVQPPVVVQAQFVPQGDFKITQLAERLCSESERFELQLETFRDFPEAAALVQTCHELQHLAHQLIDLNQQGPAARRALKEVAKHTDKVAERLENQADDLHDCVHKLRNRDLDRIADMINDHADKVEDITDDILGEL